ncbi:MAG: hypothetical protein IKE73_04565 [Bacilli bacterium]|nr:hypothetical protein [Bacilli bacterium]
MLEEYINSQPIATNLLINSINNNKLVQAYLFVSNDKVFLMAYALSFIKKIINSSNNEEINNLIDNNIYPELKIIEPKNNVIRKEDLSLLQKEFFVKPVIGNKLIYIINGAEKLNSSSANTILKFLEEPNDDVIAILLTDNLSKVLPTIKSRCQIISLKNNDNKIVRNSEYYYDLYKTNRDIEVFNFDYYKNLEKSTIKVIEKLEKSKDNFIINLKEYIYDVYKEKEDLIILFDLILYFYYDILNIFYERNILYMSEYLDELQKIKNINSLGAIVKKLKLIEDEKLKLLTNMNTKLLIDEFVLKFSEVK